jgi:antitoxin ParD1/3/4
MTMHVNLSAEMENFIKKKVATGFYGNATEVIRDAIRRMQAEESRVVAWQAAIKVGDAELLDRGEGIAYTSETLKDITERAVGAMGSGQPIDPDVLPQTAAARLFGRLARHCLSHHRGQHRRRPHPASTDELRQTRLNSHPLSTAARRVQTCEN